MWKSKFYGAFVLNHRVVLHAIDATPARWLICAQVPELGSKGLLGATREIIASEGAGALTTGMSATAAAYALQGSFKFGGFEFFKVNLAQAYGLCGNQPVCRVHPIILSSNEQPASPRHRAGVASMAWRSTKAP